MNVRFSSTVKIPLNNEKYVDELELLRLQKKRRLKDTNVFNEIPNSLGAFINGPEYFSDEDSITDNYGPDEYFTDNPAESSDVESGNEFNSRMDEQIMNDVVDDSRESPQPKINARQISEREDIPRTETEVVGMLFDEKELKSNRKKKNSKKSKGKLLRTLYDSSTSDNMIK